MRLQLVYTMAVVLWSSNYWVITDISIANQHKRTANTQSYYG